MKAAAWQYIEWADSVASNIDYQDSFQSLLLAFNCTLMSMGFAFKGKVYGTENLAMLCDMHSQCDLDSQVQTNYAKIHSKALELEALDEADEYGDNLDSHELPKLKHAHSSVNEEGLALFDMNFVQSLLDEESKSADKTQRVLSLAKIESAEQEMVQLGTILSKMVKYLKALNKDNESAISK